MRFYADPSGKDSDLVRVAGGYFATDKQWSAFEREWHLALNEAQVTCFSCH
jgi:hypothetical protein